MRKHGERLILDISPEMSEALDRTGEVAGMSRQDVIRQVLDAALPHLADLAQVFKAAKEQQEEALQNVLLGMSGKASIQAGQLTLGIAEKRAKGGGGGKST